MEDIAEREVVGIPKGVQAEYKSENPGDLHRIAPISVVVGNDKDNIHHHKVDDILILSRLLLQQCG